MWIAVYVVILNFNLYAWEAPHYYALQEDCVTAVKKETLTLKDAVSPLLFKGENFKVSAYCIYDTDRMEN